MKKLSLIFVFTLILGLLAGCAGTPVIYYTECTCPAGSHDVTPAPENKPENNTPAQPVGEGAVKTGLYLNCGIGESKSADAENAGEGKYDVTMVAVLVNDEGVITDCIIDGVASSVKFDAAGTITTDLTAPVLTKNELGDNYNMVKYGQAKAEWYVQAGALADFAVGKTVEELKSGAIDETGKAPAGSDLASSASIYLGGYVAGIEAAVANAKHLGAQVGDELKMAALCSTSSSKSADAENAGNAELDVDVAVVTMRDGVISSAVIDSVQAKVAFDATGAVTSDLTAPVKTKTELGDAYNMVAWGQAKAEWYEQTASFCAYVTGKTPAEVAGIAVDEGTKPTEADLTASVSIAIGGFQALIAKACQ